MSYLAVTNKEISHIGLALILSRLHLSDFNKLHHKHGFHQVSPYSLVKEIASSPPLASFDTFVPIPTIPVILLTSLSTFP